MDSAPAIGSAAAPMAAARALPVRASRSAAEAALSVESTGSVAAASDFFPFLAFLLSAKNFGALLIGELLFPSGPEMVNFVCALSVRNLIPPFVSVSIIGFFWLKIYPQHANRMLHVLSMF